MTHGPRVQEGWQGGGVLSLGRASLDDVGDYPEILPPSALFLRRGWAADSVQGTWGKSLGMQVAPLMLIALAGDEDRAQLLRALEMDAYVQVPAGHPKGVGITMSRYGLMPYVQYGRVGADGSSWYTTQGVAALATGNYRVYFWAPTIARRELGFFGRNAAHLQLSGALGYSRRDNVVGDEPDWSAMWMLAAGVALEIGPGPETPP